MEKLELKHLSPYLPYGLKYHMPFDYISERFTGMLENHPLSLCIALISEEERKKQLKEYYSLILTQKEPFFAVENDKIFLGQMDTNLRFELDDVYLEELKPILRQLSDLTKEIEHNGEKFVPIIKLANQNYYVNNGLTPIFDRCKTVNESNFLAYNSDTEISRCQFRFRTFGADGENSDLNFEFYDNTSHVERNKHFSTLANINKLFEWHFDIYGLIEKNLAIDINTL